MFNLQNNLKGYPLIYYCSDILQKYNWINKVIMMFLILELKYKIMFLSVKILLKAG